MNNENEWKLINNELLEECDKEFKNSYLMMLGVILHQVEKVSDTQIQLYNLLVEGLQVEFQAEEYMRRAGKAKIEDYIKFGSICAKSELKYRWLLDAILLSFISDYKKEQLLLINYFCSLYDISKKELLYIANMAKAILSNSNYDYVTAISTKEDCVADSVFTGYEYRIAKQTFNRNAHMAIVDLTLEEHFTKEIFDGILELCDDTDITYLKVINMHNGSFIVYSNKSKIVLENCTLEGVLVKDCHDVEVINSSFYGDTKVAKTSCFGNISNLTIENTKFIEYPMRALSIREVDNVTIDNCSFKNCILEYEAGFGSQSEEVEIGGVIYSENKNSIGNCKIINSSFLNCGCGNSQLLCLCQDKIKGVISNIPAFVENCDFKNCYSIYDYLWEKIEENNYREPLFVKGTTEKDCRFENCGKFVD